MGTRLLLTAFLALIVAGAGSAAPPKSKAPRPKPATTKTVVLDVTGFH